MSETPMRLFEPRDASARGVAWAVPGLFLGIALSGAAAAWMVAIFAGRIEGPARPQGWAHSGGGVPRLQRDERLDRRVIEARSRARLEGYAWIDAERSRARIPIGAAMDRLARQGWPAEEGR